MSREILLRELQQKSANRIREIHREAEARAEAFRVLKQEEYKRKKAELQQQLARLGQQAAAPLLHEAERSALAIEDEAMRRLAERLYAMARDLPDQIRLQDYASVFVGLVRELPEVHWEKVWVNPRDCEMAGKLFPGAEVLPEASISGGFTAAADDGRYRVVNTLEKRLEKGWPIFLPLLLQEIFKERNAASTA